MQRTPTLEIGIRLFVCITVLGIGSTRPLAAETAPAFFRGDANADGYVSLADVFAILRHLYLGRAVQCEDAADVDDNGVLNSVDPLFLVGAVFYRHGTIAAPGVDPGVGPGVDPTPDDLVCERGLAPLARGGGGQARVRGPCQGDDGGVADLEFIHFRKPVEVMPGQPSVLVPIQFNTAVGNVEGFTLSLRGPPETMRFRSISLEGAVYGRLGIRPRRMHVIDDKVEDGYIAASVAMSLAPPLQTLPKLQNQTIAFVEFDISNSAKVGDEFEIEFADLPTSDGSPAIVNELSRDGQPQFYSACNLVVRIVAEGELFVRGDVNRDGSVNLSDVITVLSGLFRGAILRCPDAADIDDDGAIVVTDAIVLATYLFAGGPAPLAPFPQPGRDSLVPDTIGCGP